MLVNSSAFVKKYQQSPPDGTPSRQRRCVYYYLRMVRRADGGVVTAGAQLAKMKVADHHRLSPTGAKTIGKGGSRVGDD
jgi:hypothetical protein